MTDLDAADAYEAVMDAREREPVSRAENLGHDVQWDPPAALTAVERWTCSRCQRAVLRNGRVIYGSAATETCEGSDA